VHVAVDRPAGNVDPLGGVQETATGAVPPVAVANVYETLTDAAVVRIV